jgi:tRNA(Ile)-lysidine synthase
MRDGSVRAIEQSVRELLGRRKGLVIAVSGGVDSAVLLDAIATLRDPAHRIVVASVDHGTGPAATEATARAVAAAARHGLTAISERLDPERPGEATWRAGRWAFLHRIAQAEGAPVVTAHTHDDHIETVFMRILRNSSARGLAGLLAPSPIERPLLAHSRADIVRYAAERSVPFTEDPTNTSRAFLRNRIRLDLLPAIRAVHPEFESEIMRVSQAAADLRIRLDSVAGQFVLDRREGVIISLDAEKLSGLADDSLHLLLPALLARGGVTLDRRGLVRLVAVVRAHAGVRGQVSGGYEAIRSRSELAILRYPREEQLTIRLRPSGETRFGGFRFQAESAGRAGNGKREPKVRDDWRIYIPKSAEPVVRQWHAGDRLTTDLMGRRRRVTRFFADAGIVGPLRTGWPVVLCGSDVIWIPGVRASQEAIRFEGRMVKYTCERIRE